MCHILFRSELIKIYSQSLLLQQTGFCLRVQSDLRHFPKTESWNGLDWKRLESLDEKCGHLGYLSSLKNVASRKYQCYSRKRTLFEMSV